MTEESFTQLDAVRFRPAGGCDAEAVAALHADSWRRHYRGAYSDAYLDGDVMADRLRVWTGRLRRPEGPSHTVLAEAGGALIGFAHTVLDDDPGWGALLDNLHVRFSHQRAGVASRLLALAALAVVERRTGLYLWVLEQNLGARAFYEARGGERVERADVSPPGGVATRLAGSPAKLRYAWADPGVLVSERRPARPAS